VVEVCSQQLPEGAKPFQLFSIHATFRSPSPQRRTVATLSGKAPMHQRWSLSTPGVLGQNHPVPVSGVFQVYVIRSPRSRPCTLLFKPRAARQETPSVNCDPRLVINRGSSLPWDPLDIASRLKAPSPGFSHIEAAGEEFDGLVEPLPGNQENLLFSINVPPSCLHAEISNNLLGKHPTPSPIRPSRSMVGGAAEPCVGGWRRFCQPTHPPASK